MLPTSPQGIEDFLASDVEAEVGAVAVVAAVCAESAIEPDGIVAGVGVAIVDDDIVGTDVAGGSGVDSITGPAVGSGAKISNSCPIDSMFMSVNPFNCTNCSGETSYRSAMA
jgi:hypothetical protein